MVVIGCLFLVILPIVGLALGGWLGGPSGARWGAGIGLGAALIVCGLSGYALARVARRR
ncbi:hypothetical protein [Sphingomonas aracearum]|uniref:hypothetical protein n=1 Tax=Sphingomonas aracearum TaxID=2283317 RepID=UPI0015F004B8|nr:hypothetical protein [Sphingomonas aracearum]